MVIGVVLLAGEAPYRAVGNSDPGLVVALGAPLLRLVVDVAAAVCLGSLAFVTCCARPQE
jgi:putative copper resistance protein D